MNEEAFLPWYTRRPKLLFGCFLVVFCAVNAWIFYYEYQFVQREAAERTAVAVDEARPEAVSFWENDGSFTLLGDAKPGEWRARFAEHKQSFEDWVEGPRQHPSEGRKTIYLQPIGSFEDSGLDLGKLAAFAEMYFRMPVAVRAPIDPAELEFRRRKNPHFGQEQWLTEDLLSELYDRLPDDAYAMLGLTMTDLWPGDRWNYVFGQATFSERVGVYSFGRYDPTSRLSHAAPYGLDRRKTMMLRAMKILTHETGHMFGIRHCLHYECNMNGTNSLRELDEQPLHLCPVDLRKLHAATGFDPAARYHDLAGFYERRGLHEQARFARRRSRLGQERSSR
ncbi:hypothetical protein FIV42_02035 [Persicimonas caeni]|uniref:Zn-dependent protease n=1 Tax=Persicimonas caeni TaxID=2292766 RepID=A0A4Y6PMV6_PERCE|nr:archaemetzincin [Persicimonas caeni]QDG49559.1 hypothetical protein FIV42_02035 [Persicimonas caeni]QED30780.1 hypothetical protein FRD00_02030 [Persicimonas caeni]